MKLVYDALTGKVTQEPDDESVQIPPAPEPGPTVQEQIAALQEAVDLLVLEKLKEEARGDEGSHEEAL